MNEEELNEEEIQLERDKHLVNNQFKKEGYKKIHSEDLDLLYGYYTGYGEALINGEKGICIRDNEGKDNITIVHCAGNDGTYTRSVFTIGELEQLVSILKK